ncbi:MAG: PH domain-containing protein [Candidatus Micrarchaeaceae archaeon]
MRNTENKPRISKWIGRGYLLITIALVLIYGAIILSVQASPLLAIQISIVMIIVIILLLAIVYSLYKTKYTIKNGRLYSWSPFAIVNIGIKEIAKVENTRIPFYFKGFGASVYSGRFYIPAVGWTRVIITNLTDGLLIKTKQGKNYLITPSNPKVFAKALK